jgi:DNA-directed RNA polymerase sigma subunit (sigma70/sigma32)
MKNYANAKDVLPPDLFEKVREHYTGYMYVPAFKSSSGERLELIMSLAQNNASTEEIAKITGITRRRINQILAGKRRKKWEWIE